MRVRVRGRVRGRVLKTKRAKSNYKRFLIKEVKKLLKRVNKVEGKKEKRMHCVRRPRRRRKEEST